MTARRPWGEALLAMIVLAGAIASGWRLLVDGKLPQPFVPDSWDTFMDWFNPAWWSHGSDAYSVFHSVYPPLSFVLLRAVGLPGCYAHGAFVARDCDTLAPVLIVGFYLLSAGMAALALWRHDRRTAVPRALAFAFGLPLLFALERGNLLLLCLPAFIAVYGLARGERGRAVAAAIALNFKPYLLVPLAAWAAQGRWRLLKLTALIAAAIYLASMLLFGGGNPVQLAYNTRGFARLAEPLVWEQGLYSTSLTHFRGFADLLPADVTRFFVAVPAVVLVTVVLVVLCQVGAWLRPGRLSDARLALLLLGAFLAVQSPGGYTYAFVVFLLFLEGGERPGMKIALTAAYLLCFPFDLPFGAGFPNATWPSESWLTGAQVINEFHASVGMFARPILLLVLVWALAIDSLLLLAPQTGPRMRLA